MITHHLTDEIFVLIAKLFPGDQNVKQTRLFQLTKRRHSHSLPIDTQGVTRLNSPFFPRLFFKTEQH